MLILAFSNDNHEKVTFFLLSFKVYKFDKVDNRYIYGLANKVIGK